MAHLKPLRHIMHMLLAAAVCGLLAASGVSCGNGGRGAVTADIPPTPDTLALVEGLRLFEEGEYDLAREQLLVSSRSPSTYIRAESFLYLNALEMELENYDAAHPWLDKYHLETVRLLRNAAEASGRMSEQAARLRRRNDTLAGGMIIVAVMVVGAGVMLVRRQSRGRRARKPEGDSPPAQGTTTPPEGSSGENHSQVSALDFPPPEWKRWLIDAEIFKQTAVYAEIAALGGQRPGRDAKVLPSVRQEALDGEIAAVFSDFAGWLRAGYPTLTTGDVKLCCLSLLPLSSFARALCYGSTETNIIKQRKHTIKKKLGNDPRGRALFEFIFEARG